LLSLLLFILAGCQQPTILAHWTGIEKIDEALVENYQERNQLDKLLARGSSFGNYGEVCQYVDALYNSRTDRGGFWGLSRKIDENRGIFGDLHDQAEERNLHLIRKFWADEGLPVVVDKPFQKPRIVKQQEAVAETKKCLERQSADLAKAERIIEILET